MKKIGLLAGLVAIALVAIGTLAWAAGDSPTIRACVGNGNGSVRILDASEACKKNESATQWSVQGPQGLKGDNGPQGAKGDPGPAAAATDPNTSAVAFLSVRGTKQLQFKGTAAGSRQDKWQPVLGFDYEITSPRDLATGQSTGKRQHSPIRVTKQIDAATPQLFQALVTNENLPQVVLEYEDSAGTVTYRMTLTNAIVSEERQYDVGKSGQRALEAVSFTYQRIQFEHIAGKTSAQDDWHTAS